MYSINFIKGYAREFGTPFYLYDLDMVKAQCCELRRMLPLQAHIYYSLKANPHPDIVREINRAGFKCEISSTGELAICKKVGVAAHDILFAGPGKTEHEIDAALKMGIRCFTIESVAEAQRLESLCSRNQTVVECLLRLNPDHPVDKTSGIKMTGIESQFGIEEVDLANVIAAIKSYVHLQPVGFQVYFGSQIFQRDKLINSFIVGAQTCFRVARELEIEVKVLDLGGGFAYPYAQFGKLPNYGEMSADITDAIRAIAHDYNDAMPILAFESGRFLVAGAGTLITRVLSKKISRGQNYVILDSGVNHLGGMSGLGRLPKLQADIIRLEGVRGVEREKITVVGPLCTPLDKIAKDIWVDPLEVDELVAIPNVGAYGLSASLVSFLSREHPVEATVSAGKIVSSTRNVLIRKPVTGDLNE